MPRQYILFLTSIILCTQSKQVKGRDVEVLSLLQKIHVGSSNQVLLKNMKNYLANPQNKDNLNDLIFTELEKCMPARLDTHQTLVLGGGF